jgi:hypothetical protein
VLTWFLSRYPREFWPRIFACETERGYTHFMVSWPDSRDQDGYSVEQFAGMLRAIESAGFYVRVQLSSKVFDPRDESPEWWAEHLDGPMAAWAGLVDEYGVWEFDAHNVPGDYTVRILKHMGAVAHSQGASMWAHFLPEHTSWSADERGKDGFWSDLGDDVDGLDYQGEAGWDVGQLQARIRDTLVQFARQGNRHKLRAFELTASRRFANDHPDEDEAAAICFAAIATKGPAPVWGCGDSIRGLDGKVP